MIIHEPETKLTDDRVRIASRIEMAGSAGRAFPSELWFEFPERLHPWIVGRTDPFLTALVLVAMQYEEDVEVRGSVSARLLSSLGEYRRVFALWFPWRFRPVTVRVAREVDSEAENHGAVASAFSGGVDSFYTLGSHLAENEPQPRSRISHAIFVHGFDIPLANVAAFETAKSAYEAMARRIGIELVAARTNAQDLVPPQNWGVFHGAPLIATAQALVGGLRRFYVPATHTYHDLVPWGSDPRIDHLLSTDELEVVHDGASATRIAKTAAIASWEETRGLLRVCARPSKRLVNCCRCEKCLRTMVALDMLGELDHHSTFPLPIDRRDVRASRYQNASDFCFARETIAYARERRRRDVVFDLGCAVATSRASLFAKRGRSALVRLGRRGRRALTG